jgi:exonuclease VII large subunit
MRDEAGQPVTRKAGLKSGRKLAAEFGDGSLPVRVE